MGGRVLSGFVSMTVLVGTGAAWEGYQVVAAGVTTSNALADGPKSSGKDQNILIMGLDSRLDQHGKPLDKNMYDALHAGDDSVGGYNSNVLILIHIPGDGSKATAISIPRDDWVQLSDDSCQYAPCKGKIKQAYGYAYSIKKNKLEIDGVKDEAELEQRSREAGRKAEISTVRNFLGGVPIDHFVEVTLVSFFQIAQVVQPITVCLNQNTSDDFSGADFKKGPQQIDASQAMAFVRQRRDPDESLNFTDLDRTRRQQAFIVSLVRRLQDSGTVTDPGRLKGLLDVAKQNIAIDDQLDLASFIKRASSLSSGGMTLFTLPVKDFGQNSEGEDINIVDLPEVRTIVKNILTPPKTPEAGAATAAPPPTPTTIAAAAGITLDIVNSTGQSGLAKRLQQQFATQGFTKGDLGTGAVLTTTTVTYGRGAEAAATALAEQLGLTATKSTAVEANAVRLTVGTDSSTIGPLAAAAADSANDTETPTTSVAPVSATAVGAKAPQPTDLSTMDGTNGIPCVK
ncbi:LCP family protein [Nocardia panacis]|uniref:LCP family protein n=1 Tax=Nocardia panacis TaxID=2340916 RepID=UPI001EF0AD44|nr:LCP family protein [Nocardia panacis]